MDAEHAKELPPVEDSVHRGRSDSLYIAHELTRMRSRYEEATQNRQRAQSRAESRRSLGPPKGISRMTAAFYDVWAHHISIIVPSDKVRDHLALERTFLSHLKTSQAFALLGVIIAQLFLLQHRDKPDPVLGYHAVGKPLAVICICLAFFYMALGAFRWWRHQQALVLGKAITGGPELALLSVGSFMLILTLFILSIAIAVRREK